MLVVDWPGVGVVDVVAPGVWLGAGVFLWAALTQARAARAVLKARTGPI